MPFTANNQSMMTIFFFHVSFISLHLNAPECFFSCFVLDLKTLKLDVTFIFYRARTIKNNMDSSAPRMPGITSEAQGMHVCFVFFNKGLVVWDDVSEETTHMISFHLSCTPWGCEGGKEWEGIWFSTKIRSIFYAQADFSIPVQKCESIKKSSD